MTRLRLAGTERKLPPPPTSQMAVVALVLGVIAGVTLVLNFVADPGPLLGLIGMPCALLAAVIGWAEVRHISASFGSVRGKTLAIVGLFLGVAYLAAFFVFTGPVLWRVMTAPGR